MSNLFDNVMRANLKLPIYFEPTNLFTNERFENLRPELFYDQYPDLYLPPIYKISNCGRIFNIYSGEYLSELIDHRGYIRVYLTLYNIQENRAVFIKKPMDLLVLMSFDYIPDENNYWIKHLNNINGDNRLENLMWVDKVKIRPKQKHGYYTGRFH